MGELSWLTEECLGLVPSQSPKETHALPPAENTVLFSLAFPSSPGQITFNILLCETFLSRCYLFLSVLPELF